MHRQLRSRRAAILRREALAGGGRDVAGRRAFNAALDAHRLRGGGQKRARDEDAPRRPAWQTKMHPTLPQFYWDLLELEDQRVLEGITTMEAAQGEIQRAMGQRKVNLLQVATELQEHLRKGRAPRSEETCPVCAESLAEARLLDEQDAEYAAGRKMDSLARKRRRLGERLFADKDLRERWRSASNEEKEAIMREDDDVDAHEEPAKRVVTMPCCGNAIHMACLKKQIQDPLQDCKCPFCRRKIPESAPGVLELTGVPCPDADAAHAASMRAIVDAEESWGDSDAEDTAEDGDGVLQLTEGDLDELMTDWVGLDIDNTADAWKDHDQTEAIAQIIRDRVTNFRTTRAKMGRVWEEAERDGRDVDPDDVIDLLDVVKYCISKLLKDVHGIAQRESRTISTAEFTTALDELLDPLRYSLIDAASDGNDPHPLFQAVVDRDVAEVERLLTDHPRTNDPNMMSDKWSETYFATPCYVAAYEGYTDVVRVLLRDSRTDPNKADEGGVTPLYAAVAYARLDVLEVLLRDPRIEINKTVPTDFYDYGWEDTGRTALYVAVQHAVDNMNWTGRPDPEGKQKYFDTISMLLRYGADPDLATDQGDTPCAFAEREGLYDAIVQLLREHGATTCPPRRSALPSRSANA